MSDLAGRLDRALRGAGYAIVGVSIGNEAVRATWLVLPSNLQASAQAFINAFNPDDPAIITAELEDDVTDALDDERLISAVVWVMLRQMFPSDTVVQTRTKYTNAARPQIIQAYKDRPWIP